MGKKKEHSDGAADRKGEDENEEPSYKVTDGNTHSLTACLYHSTESGRPSESPPSVKQITAVDEYQPQDRALHTAERMGDWSWKLKLNSSVFYTFTTTCIAESPSRKKKKKKKKLSSKGSCGCAFS